jgi:hypothetical protein
MSDERYDRQPASEQRGNRSPSHKFQTPSFPLLHLLLSTTPNSSSPVFLEFCFLSSSYPRSVPINSANYIAPHTVAICFHLATAHLLLLYISDQLTFLASGQAGEPGAYAATVLFPFFPLISSLWFSIPCSICRGDPGRLLRCNWLDPAGLPASACRTICLTCLARSICYTLRYNCRNFTTWSNT